ncbi:hypothetical protein NQ315_000438 [Exocentrus adspersus]|uniref:Protein sleepless n=1 Tax=Exocentrus adspersus TaxID=1586481 RepID=A0AAV8VMZ5_9CUCU|nr:hypothetical protein NQ315_000438 [Exocentrus adspersus]
MKTLYGAAFVLFYVLTLTINSGSSLKCFVCMSLMGENEDCEVNIHNIRIKTCAFDDLTCGIAYINSKFLFCLIIRIQSREIALKVQPVKESVTKPVESKSAIYAKRTFAMALPTT